MGTANWDIKKGYFYSEKFPISPISGPPSCIHRKQMKSSVNFMESLLLSPAGFIKNSAQIVFLGVQKGEEAAAPCFVLVQAVLLQKNGSVIAKCFQLFSLLFFH